jgi:hypothetical protein
MILDAPRSAHAWDSRSSLLAPRIGSSVRAAHPSVKGRQLGSANAFDRRLRGRAMPAIVEGLSAVEPGFLNCF